MSRHPSSTLALVACLAIGGVARPASAQERVVSNLGEPLNNHGPQSNPDTGLPPKAPLRTSSEAGPAPTPNGVLVEDSQLKIKNGFGAQFWVVDSEEFFLNWLRSDVRNLLPVTATRRGVPLYIAVFLLEPGSQSSKRGTRCDVTYDYEVLRPDGGCLDTGRNFVAWAARPPPPHIIQLAVSNIPEVPTEQVVERPARRYPRVLLGVIDPPGQYIINVTVHDNIKKVDIPLQRKLMLQE